MVMRVFQRLTLFGALLIIGMGAAASASSNDDKQSILTLIVLKDDSGKPVRNASVVLHSVDKNGKQRKGGQQLKTDPEGKTNYPGVPYGKLRVQVIMRGYQTFGGDFEIDKPEQEITI